MPKVSKKDVRTPLQEVGPVPMDSNTEAAGAAEPAGPSKPQFAPLSAYEQNGKKIEFRRVCSSHSSSTWMLPYWSLQCNSAFAYAGYCTTAQIDATEKQLDVAIHSCHRKYEA